LEGGVDIGIKNIAEDMRCGPLLLPCEVADEMRRCSCAHAIYLCLLLSDEAEVMMRDNNGQRERGGAGKQ
jgi:hypothetical protein